MFGRSITPVPTSTAAGRDEHARAELEPRRAAPPHEQEGRERDGGEQPAPLHASRTAPKAASTGSAAMPPTAAAAARARSGSS